MDEYAVAKICHEVNRAFCEAMGDQSQTTWEDAPQWQKDSAVSGVRFHMANPNASPADSHNEWLRHKTEEGWVYGPVKDAEKKQHPCCLPYDDLPKEQRAKDYIFREIVHQVLGACQSCS